MKFLIALALSLNTLSLFANETLLEVEKRTISLYQNSVPAVVNVTNVKTASNFFYGRVEEIPQGSGTGWVWDTNGHIVTNFHVVNGGSSFIITFHNDTKQYRAKVVGTSPKNDIAVLKLEEMPKNFKALKLGSSENLQVGQSSFAIGNPFGLDHSLTTGVISALGRQIDGIGGVKINNMIQTDAAINQGNSGGPLLNSNGEVIGMNTMIFSTSGASAGLGFAVPSDTIARDVPQLIQFGKVIRPGLGVGILDERIRERYFGPKGAAVSFVDPDGAAGIAGLKGMTKDKRGRIYPGDVILKIAGKEVNNLNDVFYALDSHKIGDKVTIEYRRDNKNHKAEVTLKPL